MNGQMHGSARLPDDVIRGARRFTVRGDFVGLHWHRPAESLSAPARKMLRTDLLRVAVQTFSGTDEEFWQDWLSDSHLDELDGLVVAFDKNGRPTGWVASNLEDFGGHRCFYANSAGVHPDYQGTGIASTIWRELLRTSVITAAPHRLYAVMRTANPLVYSAWESAAGGPAKAFPSRLGRETPTTVLSIAADAAAHLGQHERFDPETLVIHDAYDTTESGLWTDSPTSHRDDLDLWMRSLLGPRDALVLVVAFDPLPLIAREVVRTLRSSLPLRLRHSRQPTKRRR